MDLGAIAEKVYFTFPKLQRYRNLTIRLLSVISRTLVVRGLTPLQRCSRCILQQIGTSEIKIIVKNILIRIKITCFIISKTTIHCFHIYIAQLAGTVEYTGCISAEGLDAPTPSVLDMTLKNVMVRFQ